MTLRRKAIFLSVISILLVFFMISGCQLDEDETRMDEHSSKLNDVQSEGMDEQEMLHPAEPEPVEPTEPIQEPEPYYTEATLTAVGDIMMHLPQINSGFNAEDRSYNFDSFFSEVSDRLSAGDWVIGNLETTLVDEDPRGYTGYPEFNAPPELADAIKKAGFSILTTSNNHSLDRRERGVIRTLEHLQDRGLLAIGTAASPEEAEHIHVVTHQDISMAILAYTYGTNGIPIPEGKDYLVNLIDEERILHDIERAKELQPDLITVALHFGNEYQSKPTAEQQRLVRSLVSAGADLILGSHPHVLQPYEVIDVESEDGGTRKGIVIYSMGNFISNQDRSRNNNHPTEIGVIFEVDIRKSFPDESISFTEVRAIPTYVDKGPQHGKQAYRVLMLDTILAERSIELWSGKSYDTLDSYYQTALSSLEAMHVPAQLDTLPNR